MSSGKPLVGVFTGQTHSGKSTEAGRFIERTNPETVLVYNRGWEEDWKGYEEIELSQVKKVLYYKYKGKLKEFRKHFMRDFRGKRVKCARPIDWGMVAERLLFLTLSQRGFEGLHLHLEDAKGYIYPNMSPTYLAFFNATKNFRIRVTIVHQIPNQIPSNLWGALTCAFIFRNDEEFDPERIKLFKHAKTIKEIQETVNKMAPYSFGLIDFRAGRVSYKNSEEC